MKKFGRKSNHQLPEILISIGVFLLVVIVGNYFFLIENVKYLIPLDLLNNFLGTTTGINPSCYGIDIGFHRSIADERFMED